MNATPNNHDDPDERGVPAHCSLPADLVSEAIDHMNADHGDAVLAYAQGLASLTWAARARLLDIDTAGIVLEAADVDGAQVETARIAFPQPLTQPAELRMAMVDLARAARAARAAAVDPPDRDPVVPAATFDRDTLLDALAPIIATRIAARDTSHAVFHGCIDWHSAVHGHWALLRIARATGRHAEHAQAVDRAMRPEGIAEEAALLRQSEAFEMPYGRAWFLLLAEEFERWGREHAIADPGRLRAVATQVAASLDRYLDGCECSGIDACVGEYHNPSWALLRLHGWYAFIEDAQARARTAGRVAGMKAPSPTAEEGFGADLRSCEFFSRFGNYATLLIAARPEAAAELLASHPLADDALAPIRALPSAAHGLGMNWSRAWSLKAWAEAATEAQRPRLHAAYAAHVTQAWEHHALSAGNVWAYDHWVPQFAVYALTEP